MSEPDPVELLLNTIQSLEAEAEPLREQRDLMNEKAKEWAAKRDQLNAEYRRIMEEGRLLRQQRDEMNSAVRDHKSRIEQLKAQLLERRVEHRALTEKIFQLRRSVSQTENETKKRIESLEWRIQTNSLKQREEESLIHQIRSLEAELMVHKEIRKIEEKVVEVQLQVEALKSQIEECRKMVAEHASESQEYHTRMVKALDKGRTIKMAADGAHQQFVQYRKEVDQNHLKFFEVMARLKKAEMELEELNKEALKRRIDAALETEKEVSEAAYKKLMEGKKLTFEEFKILVEKGRV